MRPACSGLRYQTAATAPPVTSAADDHGTGECPSTAAGGIDGGDRARVGEDSFEDPGGDGVGVEVGALGPAGGRAERAEQPDGVEAHLTAPASSTWRSHAPRSRERAR